MNARSGATAGGRSSLERGASALEYVGLIVLAAMVVTGVFVAVSDSQVSQRVEAAVCTIVTAGQGECASGFGGDTRTPLERATAGRYVALGDSYSSGEGAGDYDSDTDYDHGDDWDWDNWGDDERNRCHRSDNAYSRIIARDNDFAGGSESVACSGAEQPDVEEPNGSNDHEPAQTDALDEDTSLVTMSIGGNDIGFADVVKDCIVNGERGVPFADSCQEKHDKRLQKDLPALKKKLVEQYRDIRKKAPNARIVIVGYPQLFEENPSDNYKNLLFKEDQEWMNGKATELNSVIREAAKEAGVEFVDPTEAFKGHGIGSDDPWINDLNFGGPGLSVTDPGSFHPNAAGHAAEADLIQQQLEDPVYP
ncbi:SGNH/GDSL hydrolase family protein [Janibacter corallicola]|uniref:SGNH/GDSL hydrolase family protein n=1 Tax=Janibacter corallicola TaxID=415212 RepID=UPI000A059315|nr:SGNH/GDSL hydrolase family protein [Janibacter corallicola]